MIIVQCPPKDIVCTNIPLLAFYYIVCNFMMLYVQMFIVQCPPNDIVCIYLLLLLYYLLNMYVLLICQLLKTNSLQVNKIILILILILMRGRSQFRSQRGALKIIAYVSYSYWQDTTPIQGQDRRELAGKNQTTSLYLIH